MYKRTIKIVHKSLQLRLIGTFLGISALAALVQTGLIAQSFYGIAERIPSIKEQLYAQLPGLLLRDVLWTLVFLVPCMLLIGVNVTHKISGPVYRINRYLEGVIRSGKITQPCALRDGDELGLLATSLNNALTQLSQPSDPTETSPESPAADPLQANTPKTKSRRTRKVIDRSLQFRVVGAFLTAGCVAVLFQVILVNNSVLDLSRRLGQGGSEVMRAAPKMLIQNMLLTMAILIPTTLLIGILMTHRIAGPAYRMRTYLNEIAQKGRPKYPCKVRDKDELQGLCSRINQAIEALIAGPQTSAETSPASLAEGLDDAPGLLASEASKQTS